MCSRSNGRVHWWTVIYGRGISLYRIKMTKGYLCCRNELFVHWLECHRGTKPWWYFETPVDSHTTFGNILHIRIYNIGVRTTNTRTQTHAHNFIVFSTKSLLSNELYGLLCCFEDNNLQDFKLCKIAIISNTPICMTLTKIKLTIMRPFPTHHIDKHYNYILLWLLEYKLLSETHALLIIANPLRNIMKLIKLINKKQPRR